MRIWKLLLKRQVTLAFAALTAAPIVTGVHTTYSHEKGQKYVELKKGFSTPAQSGKWEDSELVTGGKVVGDDARKGILILVAIQEECQSLVKKLELRQIWRGSGKQVMYSGFFGGVRIRLAVTGVLEHNAVSLLSQILLEAEDDAPKLVINFGTVGAYENGGLKIGDTVFVTESRHFDVDVPDPDPWDTRSFHLPGHPAEERRVVCTSGARFTRSQPGCSCEDMELYGLASLCEVLKLPLCSLKFVANYCNASGYEDFLANIDRVREAADKRLIDFLDDLAAAAAVGRLAQGLAPLYGKGHCSDWPKRVE